MNRPADFRGVFHLLATDAGGRQSAVCNGYRPQHAIHENYQTSGSHRYVGTSELAPGSSASVDVWLATPEAYPNCLWIDCSLTVLEGQKVVGTVIVTEIFNESLCVDPNGYKSFWEEPLG
jgi:translation elongation factor EF-Tu-like GTPase